MKKKITVIMAAVAVGALLVVGGTLAFFTDTETATNVVTTGNVDITLVENDIDITTGNPGLTFENKLMTPGAQERKDAYVKNVGSNTAYIRVKVEFKNIPAKNAPIAFGTTAKKGDDVLDSETLGKLGDKWKLFDGYYYYEEQVAANDKTTSLFNRIQIPTSWGNNMTDLNEGNKNQPQIVLTAEAVQVDNNTAASNDAEEIAKVFPAIIEEYPESTAAESTDAAE